MSKGYSNAADPPLTAEAGASAPASALPPEVLAVLSDITSQLAETRQQVADLASEVKATRSGQPRFVQMDHRSQDQIFQKVTPRIGDAQFDPSRGKQLPLGSSFPLRPEYLARSEQRFDIGDRVVLNLEASRGQVRVDKVMKVFERLDRDGKPFIDQREETVETPITWGDIVAGLGQIRCPSPPMGNRKCQAAYTPGGLCESCGWAPTIKRVEFLDPEFQWVYRLNLPGISDGPKRDQSLRDYELSPA